MVKLNHPWRILLKQQISDITDFLTFNDLLCCCLTVHGQQLRSCRDGQVNLTTLFPGQAYTTERLTSTQCTFFRK